MSQFPADDLTTYLRDLERRLAALERSAQLPSASIGEGGLRLLDGGGVTVEDGGSITIEGGDLTATAAVSGNEYRTVIDDGLIQLSTDIGTTGTFDKAGFVESSQYGAPAGGVDGSVVIRGPDYDPATRTAGATNGSVIVADGAVDLVTGDNSIELDDLNDGSIHLRSDGFITLISTGALFTNSDILDIDLDTYWELKIGGNREIFLNSTSFSVENVYTNTTAAAANVHVTGTGGLLRRSTSSLRYKRNIEPFDGEGIIDMLQPIEFDGMAGNLERGVPLEPTGQRLAGLSAENVAEVFPLAAVYDEQGRPEAYDHQAVLALLVAEVRRLKAKVERP